MPHNDEIFFRKWLPIALIILAILTAWMLYKNAMAGSHTTHKYQYMPAYGETGETNRLLFNADAERADRAVHQGNSLKWSVEYSVTDGLFSNKKAASSLTIDEINAVIVASGANEWVKINIRWDTDRSHTTNASKLWTDGQTITSMTSGQTITDMDDADVDTNEFIWLSIEGISGNIKELNVTAEVSIN